MDDRTEPNNSTGTKWYFGTRFATILFGSVRGSLKLRIVPNRSLNEPAVRSFMATSMLAMKVFVGDKFEMIVAD